MEIYLVRHTAPDIDKGICYGQADIGVKESFPAEAAVIKNHLPEKIDAVYSSPLMRCKKLAGYLYSDHLIQYLDDLKEIDCGEWELMNWDHIPREVIDPWMNDLQHVRIPGGESYADVFERVAQCFNRILQKHQHTVESVTVEGEQSFQKTVIIAHGGVIRSILSFITNTPLLDSFKVFSLHYGCVIKLVHEQQGLRHEVLSNIEQEKETHKPTK